MRTSSVLLLIATLALMKSLMSVICDLAVSSLEDNGSSKSSDSSGIATSNHAHHTFDYLLREFCLVLLVRE